jgi:hypothetical protein
MKRAPFLFSALLLAAAACKKDEPAEAAKKADDAAPADEAPPKPFEGELTFEMIAEFSQKGTGEAIYTGMGAARPFSDALARVQAKLGKPSWSDGDKVAWLATKGSESACLSLEDAGDDIKVGGGTATEVEYLGDACKAAAGIDDDKVDPDAPVPPESGETTVSVLREGVQGNKSAWLDQKLQVEGVYVSTTTASATGSDEKTTTVSIAVSKDAMGETIGCTMAADAEAPDGLVQGDEVVAEGVVTEGFGQGGLRDCTISKRDED